MDVKILYPAESQAHKPINLMQDWMIVWMALTKGDFAKGLFDELDLDKRKRKRQYLC